MEKLVSAAFGSLKAHVSGLGAAFLVYLACNQDGTISSDDKQLIVTALLAAFGITWATPNKVK